MVKYKWAQGELGSEWGSREFIYLPNSYLSFTCWALPWRIQMQKVHLNTKFIPLGISR